MHTTKVFFAPRSSTLDEKQRAIFFHVLTHHIQKCKKNTSRNIIRSFCDGKTIAKESTRYYSDCPGEGCCKKLSRCEWDEIVKNCTNKIANTNSMSRQPGDQYYIFQMYSPRKYRSEIASYYPWTGHDRCDFMHDCTDFDMREVYDGLTTKWLCKKCFNTFECQYYIPPSHFSRIDNIELTLNLFNRCIFGGYENNNKKTKKSL